MATRPPRVTSRRRQPTTRQTITSNRVFGASNVFGRGQRGTSAWNRGYVNMGRGYTPPTAQRGIPAAGATASTAAVNPYSISNLPPDALWAQIAGPGGLLSKQRDENFAALAGERFRTLSDYGFKEGPNGALTFDPNNPLSKASLLKQTYDTNRRSTGNSMAAGGQLFSGAFQNAQDLIGRNQLQAQDAQLKALQAFLASNTSRRKEALTGYEMSAAQADADRIARFQSNPLYDPATGTWKTPDGNPPPGAVGAVSPGAGPARAPAKKPPRRIYRPFQPSWRR